MMRHREHRGDPVQVGSYEVLAGGLMHFSHGEDLPAADLVVLLTEGTYGVEKWYRERGTKVIHYPVVDYAVPQEESWIELLQEIIQELRGGSRVQIFCGGGHGRTGMVLSSLVALLEPEVEDPVQTVRERYCPQAVETAEQAAFVRSLR